MYLMYQRFNSWTSLFPVLEYTSVRQKVRKRTSTLTVSDSKLLRDRLRWPYRPQWSDDRGRVPGLMVLSHEHRDIPETEASSVVSLSKRNVHWETSLGRIDLYADVSISLSPDTPRKRDYRTCYPLSFKVTCVRCGKSEES
jgi:hypothetical protein